jgi:molecular chaperone DnaJ
MVWNAGTLAWMAGLPDLYSVLGVGRDATDDEIKRAYRRLARELHPDVNSDPEAERRFKEVTAAYETLKDPARRRQYDLFGGQGGAIGPDVFGFGDFGDIFDVFFGGGIGGRRRGATRRRTRTRRGEDLFVEISLTFEEAAFGIQRQVQLQGRETCPRCQGNGCEPGTHPSRCTRCGGTGEIQDVARSIFGTVMTAHPCTSCDGTGEEIAAPCRECGGEGRVPKVQAVSIDVPPGVADGMELRISGAGTAGVFGGQSGDLYVSLRVAPHEIFERRGQDLVCALTVPMTQAALGAELEIPTLEGPESVKLEPGVDSGTVLRLRGKGIPNLGRRGRGDLFVTVLVETPKGLAREERALVERLAEARNELPRKGEGLVGRLRKLIER